MEKKLIIMFFIVSIHVTISTANKLQPPWWGVQSILAATVGQDPCVQVGLLQNISRGYSLDIKSCAEKAVAVSSLLTRNYIFGKVALFIRVWNGTALVKPQPLPTSPALLAAIIDTALNNNTYYVRTIVPRDLPLLSDLFVEFKPLLVQYYSDNGDYYGKSNLVAAEAFATALHFSEISFLHLSVTTTPF